MVKSRLKFCCLKLALVCANFGFGDALKTRPRGDGGSSERDTSPVDPAVGTLNGYRGYAGTLGVLTAAGLVIPVGIISIIYLCYIHYCKENDDDAEEKIDGRHEWDEIGSDDIMFANKFSWSRVSDWDDEDDMSASLLADALGHASKDNLEKLSLSNQDICREDTVRDDSSLVEVKEDSSLAEVKDEENLSEVKADSGDAEMNDPGVAVITSDEHASGKEENAGTLSSEREAIYFKQAVSMQVVNEVHLELKLTNIDGDLDGSVTPSQINNCEEKFMSEVQLYLPGFEGKKDTSVTSIDRHANEKAPI